MKCSEVLQCSDGTSNVSNIIRKYIENRKFLLICILLLSHSLIFLRFLFYKYIDVFLFNTAIYNIFIGRCNVFLFLAMYSCC